MVDLRVIETIPPVPPRPDDAHKGTFGTVIVVGGCATIMGAPALCASGALRSGAGLVRIAASGSVLPVAIGIEPGATGVVLGDDVSGAIYSIEQADPQHKAVLAVGPGMGRSEPSGRLVSELLVGTRTIVLDADGLNQWAASNQRRPRPGPSLVMTPHPGEFVALAQGLGITASPTRPDQRRVAASQLARAHDAVVVLKGHHTVVSDGQRVYVNRSGNPALATAGSGDVLTGAIAALIAQGMAAFAAAVLGVYLHGVAADVWAAQHGPSGLTARDLADHLPEAFNRHRHGH